MVGLDGWTVKESFLAQMWTPIVDLVHHYRGLPTSGLAALTFDPPDPPADIEDAGGG